MTTTVKPLPPTTWTVTSQTHTTSMDATGRFSPGVDIYFQTAAGNQGKVFIADSAYSVPAAQAAIAAKAAALDAVSLLTE